MYVVNEIYNYPDPDNNPCESLEIIAYTETEEDAKTIMELRCEEIRKNACHAPTSGRADGGGCYLLNDMSQEEKEDFEWDWNSGYEVYVEKIKTVTAEEWANKRVFD